MYGLLINEKLNDTLLNCFTFFKRLMKINNVNFIEEFSKIIVDEYCDNYRSRKYKEIEYFKEIIYVCLRDSL